MSDELKEADEFASKLWQPTSTEIEARKAHSLHRPGSASTPDNKILAKQIADEFEKHLDQAFTWGFLVPLLSWGIGVIMGLMLFR